MKQISRSERPNETRGNKPWTKINSTVPEKYPLSSVNKYPEVTEKVLHCYTSTSSRLLLHINAFKVSICIMDGAFTKRSGHL